MAGREKIKVYQYSDEFKYMRSYESHAEVFNKYYDGKNGQLFWNKEYKELPDGTYVTSYRIGGQKLKQTIKIDSNPYCFELNSNTNNKQFSVFNLKREKVATFKNARIASLMLNMDINAVHGRLKQKVSNKLTKTTDGLTFIYD